MKNMSIADYSDPKRDRFILSKGHAAKALYTALAMRGFFPMSELKTMGKAGSLFEIHPVPFGVPGVEVGSGSLGHGLSIGIGISLASRLNNFNYKTIVLVGDGECNEGSIWEAAMFAPACNIANLMVIIDYNKWQGTDRSDNILFLSPLREKWEAFGWQAVEIDGHDFQQLFEAFEIVPDKSGKPLAVIAHTIKGKGISFMEDDNNWHYRIPSDQELYDAHQELGIS
jgi:transketolase